MVNPKASKVFELYTQAGALLPKNSDVPSMFDINFSGSGTKYAYLSPNGKHSYHIENIAVNSKNAQTLRVNLQYYINGAWRSIPPFQIADSNGNMLAGSEAQEKVNTLYPNHAFIPHGTQTRLKIEVGGATTISVGVIGW